MYTHAYTIWQKVEQEFTVVHLSSVEAGVVQQTPFMPVQHLGGYVLKLFDFLTSAFQTSETNILILNSFCRTVFTTAADLNNLNKVMEQLAHYMCFVCPTALQQVKDTDIQLYSEYNIDHSTSWQPTSNSKIHSYD